MNETLNHDLVTIVEWGRVNRVDNAGKTQCCMLSHKRITDPNVSSISMNGVVIDESDTLDVLGKKIQCDARWANHVFQVSKEASK